jgi:hypothetical protein
VLTQLQFALGPIPFIQTAHPQHLALGKDHTARRVNALEALCKNFKGSLWIFGYHVEVHRKRGQLQPLSQLFIGNGSSQKQVVIGFGQGR